jgi:hypothetical protein
MVPSPCVAPVMLLGIFSFVFTNKWIIHYISNDLYIFIFCRFYAMLRFLKKGGRGEYEVLRLDVQIIFCSDNLNIHF